MGNHNGAKSKFRYNHHIKYSQIQVKKQTNQQNQNDQTLINSLSNWKDITHQNIYYRREYGKFKIFKNQQNNQQIEMYHLIMNDMEQYNQWAKVIQWRKKCPYLVKVQHFQTDPQREICVSQYQTRLFIQRIPLRLSDLTDIPFPQNIYFLLATLKGFKYLFTFPFTFENFKITQSMICLNYQGLVKVWLNPNLSLNTTKDSKKTQHYIQQDIIKGLIDLIEDNTDNKDYNYTFRQYLFDKKIIVTGDFNIIIQQLFSYAQDLRITIPKCVFSVKQILNKNIGNSPIQNIKNLVFNENSDSNTQLVAYNNNFSAQKQNGLANLKYIQHGYTTKPVHQVMNYSNQQKRFPQNKVYGLSNSQKHVQNPNIMNENIIQFQNPNYNQNLAKDGNYFNRNLNFTNYMNTNDNQAQSIYNFTNNQNLNFKNHSFPINYSQGPYTQRFHQKRTFESVHQPFRKNIQQVRVNSQHKPSVSVQKPMNLIGESRQSRQIRNLPAPPGCIAIEHKKTYPIQNYPYNFAPNKIQNQDTFMQHRSVSVIDSHIQPIFNQQRLINSNSNIKSISFNNNMAPFNNNSVSFNSNSVSFNNNPVLFNNNTTPLYNNTVPLHNNTIPLHNNTIHFRSNVNHAVKRFNQPPINTVKTELYELKKQKNQESNTFFNSANTVDLKYFSKKDSEETLDPQIAADLLKYINI